MAQHIRQQQQHIRKREEPPKDSFMNELKAAYNNAVSAVTGKPGEHIRTSPKLMMGMLFGFLLMIILIVVALHYFRLYSFPFLSFIPQKPAPASHLQYFFF